MLIWLGILYVTWVSDLFVCLLVSACLYGCLFVYLHRAGQIMCCPCLLCSYVCLFIYLYNHPRKCVVHLAWRLSLWFITECWDPKEEKYEFFRQSWASYKTQTLLQSVAYHQLRVSIEPRYLFLCPSSIYHVCACACVFIKIVKTLAQVLYFHSNNNYNSKLIFFKYLIASIINYH